MKQKVAMKMLATNQHERKQASAILDLYIKSTGYILKPTLSGDVSCTGLDRSAKKSMKFTLTSSQILVEKAFKGMEDVVQGDEVDRPVPLLLAQIMAKFHSE